MELAGAFEVAKAIIGLTTEVKVLADIDRELLALRKKSLEQVESLLPRLLQVVERSVLGTLPPTAETGLVDDFKL